MRVGARLLLAVLPAGLGVLTVAALAAWSAHAHAMPELVVLLALVVSGALLALAWVNTRAVARRVERLAGRVTQAPVRERRRWARGRAADELEEIERAVDRLSSAVNVAERERARQELAAGDRLREQSALLAQAAAAIGRALDEIRLPLHILLDNRFGDLNENQEEMLAAARDAAEAADVEIRLVRDIADLDRGVVSLRRDRVRVGELVQSLLPTLRALGEPRDVRVSADIAPALPAITGDRVRLQEALAIVLEDGVRRALPASEVAITVDAAAGGVVVRVAHPALAAEDEGRAPLALATRLVAVHGGTLTRGPEGAVVQLPASGSLAATPPSLVASSAAI